jgi:hypothetical protein
VRAGVDDVRLGTKEHRRQDQLGSGHQAVERQVMTEQLPAPRPGFRRFPVEGEVVAVFVHEFRQFHQLAEEAVDAHQVPRQRVPFRTQAGLHDGERGITHGRVQILEPQPCIVLHEFRVGPALPFVGVHRVAQAVPLFG